MSLRLNLSFSTTGASYPAIFVGVLLLFFFFVFCPLLLFPTCLFVSQLYFYVFFCCCCCCYCFLPSTTFSCLFFLFPAGVRCSLPHMNRPNPPTSHIPSLGLSPTLDAAAPRSLPLHILAFDSLFAPPSFLHQSLSLFRSFQYPHKG